MHNQGDELTHRPDFLLILYEATYISLWAANIIVVRVELILEADRKVALGGCQGVGPRWSNIADTRNTVNGLALQERICISNCLQDTWARE